MQVVRLTRHAASDTQLKELQRIFGDDIKVEQISESLPTDTREAVKRFDEIADGTDVVELVLPINLIEAILKFSDFSKNGGTLIRAITERSMDDEGNVTFSFSYYEKIIKVETITERL